MCHCFRVFSEGGLNDLPANVFIVSHLEIVENENVNPDDWSS